MLLKNPKVYNPVYPEEKKKFPKIYIILISFCVIAAGLTYLVFYSPVFKIKNIIVEDSLNPDLSQVFQKLKGYNIFLFGSARTENEISQKFPEVQGIKIVRGLPDTVKIAFEQRASKLAWSTRGRQFLVDSKGVIYKEAEENVDLPLVKDNNNIPVSLGQKVLSENFINFIGALNSEITSKTGFKIIRYEINETIFQVDALTGQEVKLIFDTTRKTGDQLEDLVKFLENHKSEAQEYIDLRIEGRVYYK